MERGGCRGGSVNTDGSQSVYFGLSNQDLPRSSISNQQTNQQTPSRLMKGRSSEVSLKKFAMQTLIMDSCWKETCSCKNTTHPGKCLLSISIHELQAEREHLFGEINCPPPSSKVKASILRKIAETRLSSVSKSERTVQLIDSKTTVCEAAFLVICGLCNSLKQHKPKSWQAAKAVLDHPEQPAKRKKFSLYDKSPYKVKEEHAIQWHRRKAATSADMSVNPKDKRSTIPYCSVPEMHKVYKSESLHDKKVSLFLLS